MEPEFRKSSFSNYNCVGVAIDTNRVLVRSLNDPSGPVLNFTLDEWRAFVQGVKSNEFDVSL